MGCNSSAARLHDARMVPLHNILIVSKRNQRCTRLLALVGVGAAAPVQDLAAHVEVRAAAEAHLVEVPPLRRRRVLQQSQQGSWGEISARWQLRSRRPFKQACA